MAHLDLGSYTYVRRVYNQNVTMSGYALPAEVQEGHQRVLDDGTLQLDMEIAQGRVVAVTIHTVEPRSRVYMQVFEGFEFGLDALGGWINNYHTALTAGAATGIVKGIEAAYQVTWPDLSVTLRRVSGSAPM